MERASIKAKEKYATTPWNKCIFSVIGCLITFHFNSSMPSCHMTIVDKTERETKGELDVFVMRGIMASCYLSATQSRVKMDEARRGVSSILRADIHNMRVGVWDTSRITNNVVPQRNHTTPASNYGRNGQSGEWQQQGLKTVSEISLPRYI